ncbi:MAG: flagellar biosynthetic protein FliR [Bryobacterales bacterium]|nr:flagellar biosynthetic protein FliR [Bryobacterales bacterium]
MSIEGLTGGALLSGLLVLTRVAGVCALVPVPGLRQAGTTGIVCLTAALAVLLIPVWPGSEQLDGANFVMVAGLILSELSVGLLLGLAVNLLTETFVIAAQLIGLQAGFSYASTINPTTDADANVIQVLLQLYAMLLILSFGIDRLLLKSLALSFQKLPVGRWPLRASQIDGIIALSAEVWVTALRFALPLIGLLIVLDVSLAVFGRICAQLQLLNVAFPAKILAALLALSLLLPSLGVVAGQTVPATLERWANLLGQGAP